MTLRAGSLEVMEVGIIGLGKMGRLHMMNCLKMDDVKVVAAADTSKRALNKAQSMGVSRLYTDYHDLLSHPSNLDTVIISLPNFLHFESIQLALEVGLNVFVEKPIATTVEDCRKIVRLSDESDGKFMPGHCWRFLRAVQKVKEMEEEGCIGNLEVVTIEALTNGPFGHGLVPEPVPEWWFDPRKSGGGVLLDTGYHLIDLFRFLAEDECQILSCVLDHKFNLPIEDGAILLLKSRNSNTKGIINAGWYQKSIFPEFNFRVILHGNAGFESTDLYVPRNLYVHAVKEGTKNLLRRVVGKKIVHLSYSYYYESYFKELQHFFGCIRNDSEPSISAVDGARTVELIEEAYKVSNKTL